MRSSYLFFLFLGDRPVRGAMPECVSGRLVGGCGILLLVKTAGAILWRPVCLWLAGSRHCRTFQKGASFQNEMVEDHAKWKQIALKGIQHPKGVTDEPPNRNLWIHINLDWFIDSRFIQHLRHLSYIILFNLLTSLCIQGTCRYTAHLGPQYFWESNREVCGGWGQILEVALALPKIHEAGLFLHTSTIRDIVPCS